LREIAIVVITSTNWPRIQKRIPAVADAINRIETGGYVEVAIQ
jgi:hypothetical protein